MNTNATAQMVTRTQVGCGKTEHAADKHAMGEGAERSMELRNRKHIAADKRSQCPSCGQTIPLHSELAADKAQEWTAERVKRYYFSGGGDEVLAQDINAALAAEREKATNEERLRWQQVHHDFTEALKERQQLREQLAAAEKDNERLKEQYELTSLDCANTRKREATAQAAMQLIKARCENTKPTQLAFNDILEWCKCDTTALDAAIATAQQPLVDALEWAWTIIANAGGGDWTKESHYWQGAAAKWRDEAWHPILDKLAKVKEGK